MRIQLKSPERKTYWHKWFAWHPIITEEDTLVWLETVERKRTYGYADYENEYRLIKEKLL